MMQSIKTQTYKNIITIVHSEDDSDTYVNGDIIIRGKEETRGSAPYNLYCNTLLDAIPPDADGWYCFMDDDDKYTSDTIIEQLVINSKKECFNAASVFRGYKTTKDLICGIGYHAESFIIHTSHKDKVLWDADIAGDLRYSGRLLEFLPLNWIENIVISNSQNGKGHGKRLDGTFVKMCEIPGVEFNLDVFETDGGTIRFKGSGTNKNISPLPGTKEYWASDIPEPLSPSDEDVKIYKRYMDPGTTLLLGCTRKLIPISDNQMDINPWYDSDTVIVQRWEENQKFYDNIIGDGVINFNKELTDNILNMCSKQCSVLVVRAFNARHRLMVTNLANHYLNADEFSISPNIIIPFEEYTFYIWRFLNASGY